MKPTEVWVVYEYFKEFRVVRWSSRERFNKFCPWPRRVFDTERKARNFAFNESLDNS